MSVLKQILQDQTPAGTNRRIVAKDWVKAKAPTKVKKRNVENHIVARTLKLKKAHVKKGTNVRLAEHQIEAMNRTMTRWFIGAIIVSAVIGTAVGFFVAKKFYEQSTFTAYQNGVRAGTIQRDLKQ